MIRHGYASLLKDTSSAEFLVKIQTELSQCLAVCLLVKNCVVFFYADRLYKNSLDEHLLFFYIDGLMKKPNPDKLSLESYICNLLV